MSYSSAIDSGAWGSRKFFTLTKIAQKLPTYEIVPVEDEANFVKGYIIVGSNGERTNAVTPQDVAARKLLALQKDQAEQLDMQYDAGLKAGQTMPKYSMPRKYSKSQCTQTSCSQMGFSQKASCRPYKNCYK